MDFLITIPRRGATVQRTFKTYTMQNRLKTQQDKLNEHYAAMQKQYAKDSISLLNAGIIILTCLIVAGILENL